tara:strand:- start:2393 stop:2743 length:351 start_codon:yes stop_codon:yes gene_type:complete
MIEIKTIAWTGGSLVIFFSIIFLRVIQLKIQGWNENKISPLPLEGFLSITSYISTLVGLTIMFTAVFEIFYFSPINSLIASLIIALSTGLPMWSVVKGLLKEVESGELREIVPGKF